LRFRPATETTVYTIHSTPPAPGPPSLASSQQRVSQSRCWCLYYFFFANPDVWAVELHPVAVVFQSLCSIPRQRPTTLTRAERRQDETKTGREHAGRRTR